MTLGQLQAQTIRREARDRGQEVEI